MPVATSTTLSVASTSAEGKNIWVAAGEGDLARVQQCVDIEHISPTAPDEFTYTPLHAAASYGHLDILRFLLSHPSAPEKAVDTTDEDLDTPLFVCETVETARCLIEEFGADARHKNSEGLTAAQQAMENEHEDLARYLASVTGESLDAAEEEEEEEEEVTDEPAATQTEEDARIDAQTDALMSRVGEIMTRAEREGRDPEPELRELVSESVLRQLVEGMNRSNPSNTDNTDTL
ncbi:Ankyrin repeat-containing domain protein [Kalmanozyma brasiliensis GHG001]|uniref:Uncharacterized protein n=1 Tax=Kalmanozyma brasiliensis (strain GHG001) TaxID=1365824 RepID=V5EMR3_KALBG|nr:Ankyrin repeat-containing domain protein [Kalmanozyma brasiliensis GHG001]EST06420.1 Ankyrin repeat-containing domain protein [Kalmanozyma brasiliensis GHG001]